MFLCYSILTEFINPLEHLLNIMLVIRDIYFPRNTEEQLLTMLPFIQGYCCKESDIERHTRTRAKIRVVLRNWNRSEDGNVF